MNNLLESDRKNISQILELAKNIALNYFATQNELPASQYIKDISFSDLPQKGISAKGAIDLFAKEYANKMNNSAGPRYFGFVTGGSTPASVAGDWLVSAYDQNACGSNDSIAPQLERQTLHLLKQLFGIDEAYFGSFVTGATISNFVSLSIARQWAGEQQGVDISNEGLQKLPFLKVVSSTAHSSIIKSLSMLGFGRNAWDKINTLENREAINLAELENYLAAHIGQPVIFVANAGTVNTVDFDDLEAIGQLKKKYNFWLHVDAAFGGFAAISPKFQHLMKGINHADSITIDAHKWLNVPYDAAMQFTRHQNLQLKVFQNSAAYLGDPAQSPDFFHYTPENSRRLRALPSWFTLMAYGKEGHQEIVERNCNCANLFGDMIEDSNEFKLLSAVRMNVVCFTFNQENPSTNEIATFLAKIRDDGRTFFTPTNYKGVSAIRAAFSNWQTTEADVTIAFQSLIENY